MFLFFYKKCALLLSFYVVNNNAINEIINLLKQFCGCPPFYNNTFGAKSENKAMAREFSISNFVLGWITEL